ASAVREVAAFEIRDAQRLALSPDGKTLAVEYEHRGTPHEMRVMLCDVGTRAAQELEPRTGADTLTFSGDGRRLMAGSPEAAVLWDARTGKLVGDHKGGKLGDCPGALDHTGERIVVVPYAHGRDRVYFLDAATGKPTNGLTGPEVDGARWAAFSPDGKTV